MNLGTAKKKTSMLVDNYSKSGLVQDQNDAKHKDYTLKMPFFFDIAQKQVATIKKILKAKLISHAMPVNKLQSPMYQFDIVQNIGTDQIYQITGTANAYCFMVDDLCDVKIEEQTSTGVWSVLVSINNPIGNAGLFTEYKGRITPSNALNDIRIRFIGGANMYNHRNRALWSEKFSSDARVPSYQRYVLYTVGTDLYQLNKVILKGQVNNSQCYENTADFFWEKKNVIAIGWYNVGEYNIEYFAYPTEINDLTADSYEFEVDIDAQEALPFFVASQILVSSEDKSVSDRLLSIYNTMLANLNPKITSGANMVENTLFTGGGTGKLI